MKTKIRNSATLATDPLRIDALAIAEAGYAAVDTATAVATKIHLEGETLRVLGMEYDLTGRRVFFVGVGKCAVVAAEAIEKLLDDRLEAGIALDVTTPESCLLSKVKTCLGTHPLPTNANEAATQQILSLLSGLKETDLVIMLVSGGGSTLLCLNQLPMTCLDEAALFTELTSRGATIQEINTVRKHTSLARGGHLAAAAYPAEVLALVISDVPGNDLGFIASGPAIKDDTTVADAEAVLKRYDIPMSDRIVLIETPKEEKFFERAKNVLFLTNRDALFAMQAEAMHRGYKASIVNEHVSGEARDLGFKIVDDLRAAPPKSALLYAGESTITLGEHYGAGGRGQEVALAALTKVGPDEVVLPFSSDGRDNTDHAGAIADETTLAHARENNVPIAEYLANHRTYDFFKITNDALLTGYTGSNVSDLIIALKK